MPYNATALWNLHAPGTRFLETTAPGINPETTFAQAYRGQDFAGDFHRIVMSINAGLHITAVVPPGYTGDDLLLENLSNYPPQSWV